MHRHILLHFSSEANGVLRPLPICILKLNRDQQGGILEELQGEGNKYFLFDIAGTLIVQREEAMVKTVGEREFCSSAQVAMGRERCQGRRENCWGNRRVKAMCSKTHPAEHSVDLKYASPVKCTVKCVVKRTWNPLCSKPRYIFLHWVQLLKSLVVKGKKDSRNKQKSE